MLSHRTIGRMRRVIILLAAVILCSHAAAAQQKLLTLDDIYGPGSGRFYGKGSARLTFLDDPWMDETHYLWPSDDPAAPGWLKVDARSGASQPLFDRDKFIAALLTLPRMTRAEASTAPRRPTN